MSSEFSFAKGKANMKQQFDKVSPVTGHVFSLSNFSVEESLLGRRHKFEFGGKRIAIRLPTKKEIGRYGPESEICVGRLESHKPGPRGGLKEAKYKLFEAKLSIQMIEVFNVPKKLPPEAVTPYEAMNEGEQESLLEALQDYGPIANHAFRYWLRVLRWKTGLGLLGREISEDYDRQHDSNTIDPRSGESFGYGYGYFLVPARQLVTRDHWNECRKSLRKKTEPPVWVDWILDGELLEANGNIRGAAANYAIACESFLLSAFFAEIPKTLDDDVLNIIERQVYGRAVLEGFAKSRFAHMGSRDWKRIHELFNIRNDIFHIGSSSGVTSSNCSKLRQAVHKLIYDGSKS